MFIQTKMTKGAPKTTHLNKKKNQFKTKPNKNKQTNGVNPFKDCSYKTGSG